MHTGAPTGAGSVTGEVRSATRGGDVGEFVRLEVDGGIGTIRLDRPKMNALNVAVQEEIRAAATEAAERDDVRAVIVYGGERVFAAGAHIKEKQGLSYTHKGRRPGRCSRRPARWPRSPSRPSPPSPATPWAAAASWPCAATSGSRARARSSASPRSSSA